MPRPKLHLAAALAHLQEHGETRMNELALALHISPGTLYSACATSLAKGEILKRNEGRSCFYRLPGQPPVMRTPQVMDYAAEEDASGLVIHTWEDGDIDVYGLVELDNGGRRLTRAMAAKMKQLLAEA